MEYLGHLERRDPLFDYFRCEIQPRLGGGAGTRGYRVFRLNASNDVYLYEDRESGRRLVGKFFRSTRAPDSGRAVRRLNNEYDHLQFMRGRGFSYGPHRVARALGRNPALNALLVTEYCPGELLSKIIDDATRRGGEARLYAKLTALGFFLATFHNRTASSERVDFDEVLLYADKLTEALAGQHVAGDNDCRELRRLRHSWKNCPWMSEDCRVFTHGDATPENFRFGAGLEVAGFDLERLRETDRVFDVGRLAAELAHFFMAATGDRGRAEPFIGHLLWEYACHFPDRAAAFQSITRRIPFYMGINFLRIARNDYLAWDYRKRLVNAALECLAGGLAR